MDQDELVAATAVRRRAVADLLEGLPPDRLRTRSLCSGWDVGTVGAHLADAAAPGALGPFLIALVRAGGRVHRANDAAARRAGLRPVAETVALLRERAESRFVPPVTGPRAPLTEVLVHEVDVRVPLGLPAEVDGDAVRVALDFVTTGRPVGFVRRGLLRGVRLQATDLDQAWGEGEEVRGAGLDLLAAVCGRSAVLPRLDGPGRLLLAGRTAGPG